MKVTTAGTALEGNRELGGDGRSQINKSLGDGSWELDFIQSTGKPETVL